jgi:hypothetical protein
LAVAQGYVSFRAQYSFVHAIKHERAASMLEALGLDAAAVIFALLGLAQARLGRPALAERALNLACVGGSLAMNALPATITDPKSVAAWIMPALLYAAASDRLIAVVRRRALARTPEPADQRSAYQVLGGAALWLLRLALAPPSTYTGFRRWVITVAPIAPGLPPNSNPPATRQPGEPAPPAPPQQLPTRQPASAEIRHLPLPNGSTPTAPHPPGDWLWSAVDGYGDAQWATPNGNEPANGRGAQPQGGWRDSPGEAGPTRGQASGSSGHPVGVPHEGDSKRARMIQLYDAAGAAGDPRHNTREGVGPMAKQLHAQAGLARPSTARNYLHHLLDQRGIPRRRITPRIANAAGSNEVGSSTITADAGVLNGDRARQAATHGPGAGGTAPAPDASTGRLANDQAREDTPEEGTHGGGA